MSGIKPIFARILLEAISKKRTSSSCPSDLKGRDLEMKRLANGEMENAEEEEEEEMEEEERSACLPQLSKPLSYTSHSLSAVKSDV